MGTLSVLPQGCCVELAVGPGRKITTLVRGMITSQICHDTLLLRSYRAVQAWHAALWCQ